MAATIATFQAMLLQDIEPKIQDQIDWVDVLLDDSLNQEGINKTGVKVDQKNNSFEITSLNSGMTAYAAAEGAALISSDLGLEKMTVPAKFTRASYRLGHESLQATIKDRASLEEGTALYGMEIRRAMLRSKWRVIRGNGTGIVGVLPAGVVTGITVTLSAKAPGTIASQNRYGLGALQVFQPGQNIEMGTEAAFLAGTQVLATIATVPSDTTITLTASKTFGAASGANNRGGDNSDTWYIRFSGTYGVTPMGLLGLVDNGTLEPGITTIQGLTRATTPYMQSVCYDKANATTIIKDFRDLYSAVRRYNQNVKYFVVSEDVYAKYTDAVTVTVQANQKSMDYKSKLGNGHTGLEFAYGGKPVPIFLDTMLPSGFALLLDSDQLLELTLFKDAYIEDGIMTRVPGYALYETARAAYYNFGTYSSRKLGGKIMYQTV